MDDENKQALDLPEFIKRHLFVKSWINYREQTYTKEELLALITKAKDEFMNKGTLVYVDPPLKIVGDIHGQYVDLVRLLNQSPQTKTKEYDGKEKGEDKELEEEKNLKKMKGFSAEKFVFLGDYVDRGSHSIECISLMFALKVYYPKRFVLLRGNHETKAINFAYGFKEELTIKLGDVDGTEVWEKFNEAFAYMPLACLVGHKILCMHGGIGPDLKSFKDIEEIVRPVHDVATNKLAQDLLWADPCPDQAMASVQDQPAYNKNMIRGLSVTFNEAAVVATCQALKLELIVRAHQMIPDGFKFFAKHKLITIFSAPRYMNETDNRGVTLDVPANGNMGICQMKHKKGPKVLVDDEVTRGDDLPISNRNVSAKKKSDLALQSTQSSSSNSKSTSKK